MINAIGTLGGLQKEAKRGSRYGSIDAPLVSIRMACESLGNYIRNGRPRSRLRLTGSMGRIACPCESILLMGL